MGTFIVVIGWFISAISVWYIQVLTIWFLLLFDKTRNNVLFLWIFPTNLSCAVSMARHSPFSLPPTPYVVAHNYGSTYKKYRSFIIPNVGRDKNKKKRFQLRQNETSQNHFVSYAYDLVRATEANSRRLVFAIEARGGFCARSFFCHRCLGTENFIFSQFHWLICICCCILL